MQTMSTILILITFFIMGTFSILSSIRPSNLAEEVIKGSREFYRSYGASWRKRLLAWHVIDHELETSDVLKDVITSWELIQAPQKFATGGAMILYSLTYLLWMFLTRGALLKDTELLIVLWMCYCLGTLFGGSLGYAIGFWRAKQEVRRRITYAELRQRHLSDYRSNLLRWLLGIIVVLNAVLFLVLPSVLELMPYHYSGTLKSFPIIMFVLLLLGEIFMSRIAVMPRLVVTSNPTVAQHADDLLRALVLTEIYMYILLGIGFLLFAQWFLCFQWLLSSPIFIALQIIMTILWLLCFIPVGLRTNDKGRLGGRITGWAWHRVVFP